MIKAYWDYGSTNYSSKIAFAILIVNEGEASEDFTVEHPNGYNLTYGNPEGTILSQNTLCYTWSPITDLSIVSQNKTLYCPSLPTNTIVIVSYCPIGFGIISPSTDIKVNGANPIQHFPKIKVK